MDRSPQVRPVIFQAGASEPGRELAARTADVVFTLQTDISASRAFREDIRRRAHRFGRDPDKIKILPGITPIVGKTDHEARNFREQMRDLIPEDLAVSLLMHHTGGLDLRDFDLNGQMPDLPETNAGKSHQQAVMSVARRDNLTILQTARYFAEGTYLKLIGTSATIADTMQEWLQAEACDGFLVVPAYFPRGVQDFVHLVIPELQRRGVFRKEYSGRHLRDHLGVTSYN
jgi:N-acetyl-S-(2-succino)cysteine monooxygenase